MPAASSKSFNVLRNSQLGRWRSSSRTASQPFAWRIALSNIFEVRIQQVRNKIVPVMSAVDAAVMRDPLTDDSRWLRDNSSLVYSELATVQGDIKLLRHLPHVRTVTGETVPRVLAF